METFLSVIGVLAIPVVWGLLTARVLEWLRERRREPKTDGGREG